MRGGSWELLLRAAACCCTGHALPERTSEFSVPSVELPDSEPVDIIEALRDSERLRARTGESDRSERTDGDIGSEKEACDMVWFRWTSASGAGGERQAWLATRTAGTRLAAGAWFCTPSAAPWHFVAKA